MSPRLASHVLEGREAGRAEALEERDLGLDDRDTPGRGVHDAQPELTRAGGRGIQPPLAQQPLVRVDSDAQRTAIGHREAEPLAEPGHRRASRSSAYSCRLFTSKPSPRTPSADTAAPSTAIVVNSALSPATAAARIS